MPRVRFTIRAMMVAVVVAAIVFGIVVLRRRHLGYSERARLYGMWEKVLREDWEPFAIESVEMAEQMREQQRELRAMIPDRPADDPALYAVPVERLRRIRTTLAYFTTMRAKYERAARYPWLYVGPDPPPPSDGMFGTTPDK